jgi:DNA-binding transcriptional LysR family regulator
MREMHERRLTLEQLRSFVAVAEHEHVTRAAEGLGLSQPSISHQLKALEEALGLDLLERVGRGVRISQDGRALLPAVLAALRAVRDLKQLAAARAGLVEGNLVVAASNTIGIYRLPGWLGGFVERYPGIDLKVRLVNTHEAIALLRDASVDVALVEGPEPRPELVELEMETDELLIVAGAHHPLTLQSRVLLEDLSCHRYLAREAGSGTEALAAAMLGPAYRAGPVLELGQVDAVRAAAVAGLGYTVLSRAAISEDLVAGRLRQLPMSRPKLTRGFSALRRPTSHAPALEAFWEHLVSLSPLPRQRRRGART